MQGREDRSLRRRRRRRGGRRRRGRGGGRRRRRRGGGRRRRFPRYKIPTQTPQPTPAPTVQPTPSPTPPPTPIPTPTPSPTAVPVPRACASVPVTIIGVSSLSLVTPTGVQWGVANINRTGTQVIIISLTELNQNIPLAQSNPFVVGFVGNSAVVRSPTFFSTYTVVYSPLAQPSFLCALGAADCIVCLFYEGEKCSCGGENHCLQP
ncbi:unnamed protein product [Sphacelaria rigidula]